MDIQEKVDQQQENGKVDKQYADNFEKLVAVFGGTDKVNTAKKRKVPADAATKAIDELLADRQKDAVVKFKESAGALIDKIVEFEKFKKKSEEDMVKAIQAKKKELNDEMNKTFGLLESADKMKAEYMATLAAIKPQTGTDAGGAS